MPNGWFIVARSDELAPGEMRPLYAFGRDLVLFRTEGGEARLLDAHCPHLGAHLAVGGRVEGECIRCPFHGWRFDGDVRGLHRDPLRRRHPHPGPGPGRALPDASSATT